MFHAPPVLRAKSANASCCRELARTVILAVNFCFFARAEHFFDGLRPALFIMPPVGIRRAEIILTIFSLLCLLPHSHAQISFFNNPFTRDSLMGAGQNSRLAPSSAPHGFSDQSAYVSLSSSGALIGTGDFNRDRFIDLLMLDSKSLRRLAVMLWDHDAYSFHHVGRGIILDDDPKTKLMGKITGVHVADFGNDGTLDVLAMDGTQGFVFFGDANGNFTAATPAHIPDLPPENAVMDANADFVPDVFVAYRNNTRGFWVYNREKPVEEQRDNQKGSFKFHPWPGGASKASDGKDCVVINPTSIAFADMDGDCLADLVIPTSCGLEVWTNPAMSNKKFWELSSDKASHDMKLLELDGVFNAAHGDWALAFADFDADGTIDIAVPNRNRQDLQIHLNKQRRRPAGQLCTRDPGWTLERRLGLAGGQMNLRAMKMGPLFGSIEIPTSIHVGDFDFDGMPDILTIDGSSTQPALFRNLGVWKEDRLNEVHFKRMERTVEEGLSKGNSGAVAGMFFDTDESGRQDMLIVRRGNETRLIWNNLQAGRDSLFFKGTMLSALGYHLEPRPFAPVAGNTLKVSYRERASSRRVTRTCSQCSQSGHWQLRACNCQFGLMNIANYIEELWAGGGASARSWPSLMPNSMALIWAEGGNVASSWWMEYFTQRRGGQMLRVVAVLLGALVVLGLGIVLLQHKERKEDREEDEEERARLFNFV